MTQRTAILLMAYGSPDRLEDVEPYFTDIRGGRPPSADQRVLRRCARDRGTLCGVRVYFPIDPGVPPSGLAGVVWPAQRLEIVVFVGSALAPRHYVVYVHTNAHHTILKARPA